MRFKLVKGISYRCGEVYATKKHPVVESDDPNVQNALLASGYFKPIVELAEHKETPVQPISEGSGDTEDEESAKKALSKMNTEELTEYAIKKGINVTACKTNKEIRDAIKEAEARAAEARNVLFGE